MDQSVLEKVVLGLLGFAMAGLWNSHNKRLDNLEHDKADKEAVDRATTELAATMREHRQETRDGFKGVFERLNTISDRLTAKGE